MVAHTEPKTTTLKSSTKAPEASEKRDDTQPAKTKGNEKKKIASRGEYGGDKEDLVYKSGIPTLRSSAHRVKFDVKRRRQDPKPRDRDGNVTNTTWLPSPLLAKDVFQYDVDQHDLRGAIISLLQTCDPEIVGTFEQSEGSPLRLEDFRIPVASVWRSVNGGCCEDAQKYLSGVVASNEAFLNLFDRFVSEVALPYLKRRLVASGGVEEDKPLTFYYQWPPTMRLQPGPGWAKVKPHNDAEYGHQNGELNFWIPLTDRTLTTVDLWSETTFKADDYHPIPAEFGEAISFHGSSCRHYVNANSTDCTRVSLDFRVGVQGFFDPFWQMKGTTDDHGRREVSL
jgi:hypothetical protein